ncbi:MAG: bifunctional phosphopantothenoylcysteine decarboxylase/phosphopantothenate--cysteine ligase CoaBC, partial [Eubacteriales bacterium]|nr:bifunctional phosphopantothenoylcysteine decarboxylase/phosphopantothenate--cysteine ligase CoaBC [Eubacteriales bacterium]
FEVEHVSLAKKADLFMVAPATADIAAKLAYGICDDMLTTTFLACECPKYVVPSMNTRMYNNPVTQDNLNRLSQYGVHVIRPESGYLACGDTGTGKMPEPEVLFGYIEREIARPKDMKGKHVIVTAGATQESMDPVRFITNHSTGKMGFALARECVLRGADVCIVKASVSAEVPGFCTVVEALSAGAMYEEVMRRASLADYIFMAAAVADYTPAVKADHKIKKKDGDLSIDLSRTKDILKDLGLNRTDNQFLCGFSMETENLEENSRAKLIRKNVDMIVANNLKDPGAGFGTDTNLVTLITKKGSTHLPLLSKEDTAKAIVDAALAR